MDRRVDTARGATATTRVQRRTSGDVRFDSLSLVTLSSAELWALRTRMQMVFQNP